MAAGALSTVRVIEIASIGPGPHAAMMLADMGADIVRVERPRRDGSLPAPADDPVLRGRTRIGLDLKDSGDVQSLHELVRQADVLIEGFRPGTAERLGIGPEQCLQTNPSLIYGRMTGWGQYGPLASTAGHDINYIALTGALHSIGLASDPPHPPLNLVGDFGGGSTYLTIGTLAALVECSVSGRGQVVDAAMVDAVSSLMQMVWLLRRDGIWNNGRASNSLDGAAPFYRTYRCSDGRFVAIGAIEPAFYEMFVRGIGFDPAALPGQRERDEWERIGALFAARLAEKPRDYWASLFADCDGGARTRRFVVCHNPVQADHDAAVRENLVAHLEELIDGSDTWTPRRRDELVGSLKSKPGLRRYLRRTNTVLLRIDHTAIKTEADLDGKWLLRTSDTTLTPEDLAAAYKQLLAVEAGWRDMKGSLGLRPVFHHREDRIRAHVQLCWLALLLIRVAETATGDTWRSIRHELDRMHLVTLATDHGQVAQRSAVTAGQRKILTALELSEPPRFFDFAPTDA